MSFKIGDLLTPTGPIKFQAQMSPFGHNDLTPTQQQVLSDWDKGKFQRSDWAPGRAMVSQTTDNFAFAGLPVNRTIDRFGEKHLPNTYGSGAGTDVQNQQAAEAGYGDASAVSAAQLALANRQAAAGPKPADPGPKPVVNMAAPVMQTNSPTQAELELLKAQGYIS